MENRLCKGTNCITPYYKTDKVNGMNYAFPCGKCPPCLKRRASSWSFRIMNTYRHCDKAVFMTYTYNTDHVPITPKGYMTLCKKDMQLYMKRLRYLHDERHGKNVRKLKYYTVGEYGSENKRPHYHSLLFNADLDLIEKAWIDPETKKPKGTIKYGEDFKMNAVAYCLKYMTKPPMYHHENDDRQKEFSLMSKGLGKEYLTENMISYHKEHLATRMYCTTQDGKKLAMPRYYKNKIYNEDEKAEMLQEHIIRANELNEENEKALIKKYGKDWKHHKVQRDAWAFEKMYNNSTKNRTL